MSKPLTIVHVVRGPIGGIYRHINDLARAQTQAGHRVGVICDSTSGGPLENAGVDRLNEDLHWGAVRIFMRRSISPADLPALVAVDRRIRKIAPDVIHSHGAKGGVFGRLAGAWERRRGKDVATFYAPHGGSLHYDVASRSGRLYFAVERALERVTDGLIHVSDYEARTYRAKVGVPRCPAYVVRNGISPEEFVAPAREPNPADLLYVGILRDLKGFDVLLAALAAMKGRGLAPTLLAVGYGEDADTTRYRAFIHEHGLADQVRFSSPMPAREAFGKAKLMVVPSRAESMPYIVLEAAAAGIPLVATDVGGIPEILQGRHERLVPAADADALAGAIQAALGNLGRSVAEAVLRKEQIRERFSLSVMADGVEAIYRHALEKRYRAAESTTLASVEASH